MKKEQNLDQILKERARFYSKHIQAENNETGQRDVLVIRLGDEQYGIPSEYVHEVQKRKTCTPLPGTPDFILGLINVRGKILGLVDLRPILGITDKSGHKEKSIIIIRHLDFEFAFEVEQILGQLKFSDSQLNSSFQGQLDSNYLEGIYDNKIMIVDIKSLIDSEVLIVNNKK